MKFNTRKVGKQKKTAGRDVKDKKIYFKKVSIFANFVVYSAFYKNITLMGNFE